MSEIEIFELLARGGDASLLVIVYFLWRLDRRLIVIESFIERIKENDQKTTALIRATGFGTRGSDRKAS